ncbi:tetratricopeptide repeat protein [Fulvivirga ligni]|uniref:tetratricopeptide repeat protein n=1 Tax=Fulvivirga ligni TaxID=2904246 RepID=UPI001F187A17|nr:hypothetical protein [Fulvivirga ligni]UII21277.1 hypothetical protein LVD16_25935 [Fulvivirga ligni]
MNIYEQYIEDLIPFAEDAIYEGDYHLAHKLLMSGLTEEPGYPKLHYTMGWMHHYYQTNEALAERHYLLALHFNPNYIEVYEDLVELYWSKRKYQALSDLMVKAEKCDDIDKDYVFGVLGKVAETQGEYRKAIGYYRKALMNSVDNHVTKELKQNIKRTRLKRFKNNWRWQQQS